MFASPTELLAAAKSGRWKPYGVVVNDEATAQKYVDDVLKKALDNKQSCKDDRPWSIVDFCNKLAADQAWIGFEFETGFDSKEEYKKFINFLWGLDHVAIDREGTGNYPVEVAFPPQELQDIQANAALLERAIRFISDEKLTPALNPTTFTRRDVGIHAGISTPKSRAHGRELGAVVRRLDGILHSLNDEERLDVYGRTQLHWGCANDRYTYVELKMFRAIPELDRVQRYIKTVEQITKLLDYLIDNQKVTVVKNIHAFLRGDTDEIEV